MSGTAWTRLTVLGGLWPGRQVEARFFDRGPVYQSPCSEWLCGKLAAWWMGVTADVNAMWVD
jgi:hypothetical protein